MDMERAINTQVAQRATKYFLHHVYILAQSGKEYKFTLAYWCTSTYTSCSLHYLSQAFQVKYKLIK